MNGDLPQELARFSTRDHALAGRYVMLRRVGSGGMATVYAAQDLLHDREVAVKVLRAEMSGGVNAERFVREIQIAARLTHPHILTVHDSGAHEGLLYYVMPYVEDPSLEARLAGGQTLPIDDALRIVRDVAAALQYAHDRGVVHRDIKPANVLLPGGVAVVADFGLARAIERDAGSERLTEAGMGVGTPLYMSPEQATGEGDVDARADQYALACVAYELLTGKPPFTGDSFQKLLTQHLTAQAEGARLRNPAIAPHVEAALQRALAKDPNDRFASMQEFSQALAGTSGSSVGWTVRARRSVRTVTQKVGGRGLKAAATVGVLAVASVVAWRSVRPPVTLDANLVMVTPFDVLVPTLSMWREGMLDVLSNDLDGAGPLRSVAASKVVPLSEGMRVDRGSVSALARRLGAGIGVFGQMRPLGPDSVRVTITVLDVTKDAVMGEGDYRGAVDRLDQLADSLDMRVLAILSKTRPIAAVRSMLAASRSLPALKAFLKGEQWTRRNDLREAQKEYEQAVGLDSTFALAYRRLGSVRKWLEGEDDATAKVYALRAGASNHGLSPRDSLLTLADSIGAAFTVNPNNFTQNEWLAALRRRHAVLEQAAARFADDPEVLTELGELQVHSGERIGIPAERALLSFEAALATDSTYGPAFAHAIELSLHLRAASRALVVVDRYLRTNPRDERYQFLRLVLSGADSTRILAAFDSFPEPMRWRLVATLRRRVAEPDLYLSLARRNLAFSPTAKDTSVSRHELMFGLIVRGRMQEAARERDATLTDSTRDRGFFSSLALAIASAGGMSPPAASSMFDEFQRQFPNRPNPRSFAWWAAQRDTAAMLAAFKLNAAHVADTLPTLRERNYSMTLGAAYLALTRRDTASALKFLLAVQDSLAPHYQLHVRIDVASILVKLGRVKEAAAYLDARPPWVLPVNGWEIPWRIARARIARQLGDAARARAEYALVAATWARADPALQPVVKEASDALAALGGTAAP